MNKRLQVVLDDVAWTKLQEISRTANRGFDGGRISYADIINFSICSAQVNIKKLQAKHINIKKSLRSLAQQKDIDVDSAIEALLALKKGNIEKVRVLQSEVTE